MYNLPQEHLEDLLLFCDFNILENTRIYQTDFFQNKTKYNDFEKISNLFNFKWLIGIKQTIINKNTLKNIYIVNGNLEIIKYMYYKKVIFDEDDIDICAENGYLDILIFLESKGINITNFTVLSAIERGKINVVKYIIKYKNTLFNFDWYIFAIEFNQFEIFKFLHISNCPFSSNFNILLVAACSGNLDIIKYIIDNVNFLITDSLITSAAANGHFDIVKYFHSMDFPIFDGIIDILTWSPKIEIIDFFIQLGYKFSFISFDNAILHEDFDLIRYLNCNLINYTNEFN